MIGVVVLTYNGKQYLPSLFKSLAGAVCREQWKLYIVDNASTDGTTDFVRNFQFPISNFQFISNSRNLGFAEGNNVGIRAALDEGAEFVVLLNQDTEVDPHWLDEMITVMRADATIGAAQARLMLWPEKDKVNSLGNEIHYLGFGYSGGYRTAYGKSQMADRVIGDMQFAIREIAYASGAAAMYRAAALRDVGLLDVSLFLYHEDLDLGWRLWLSGWKNVLATAAVVYHKYEFSRSMKKFYYMERNRFLVLLELYRLPTFLLIAPVFVVVEIGLLIKSILSGWGREKMRAYAFFLRPSTWRLIVLQRRAKQAKRRVRDRDVIRVFTGKISAQEVIDPVVTFFVNPLLSLYWRFVQVFIVW